MATSAYETAYLAIRRCGLHGTELTMEEKQSLVTCLRNMATLETAVVAPRAQAVTLQAAADAHAVAWAAVLAIGAVVDGTRAAAATAIDAAIVTSEALVTAWALHEAILAKTALDTDNTALDTLGALDPAMDTSADFNTNIGLVVTSLAAAVTAMNLVLDPVQALDTAFPDAIPSLAATPLDLA